MARCAAKGSHANPPEAVFARPTPTWMKPGIEVAVMIAAEPTPVHCRNGLSI